MDYRAFADELEKIAVNATGLRAAVKRIKPKFVPVGGVEPITPSNMGTRLRQFVTQPSLPERAALVGPQVMPSPTPRVKAMGKALEADMDPRNVKFVKKHEPAMNAAFKADRGQIVLPRSPEIKDSVSFLEPHMPSLQGLSPRARRFVDRGATLHEASERKFMKTRDRRLWDEGGTHMSHGVLADESNLYAGIRGKGAEEARNAWTAARRQTGEAQHMEGIVNDLYGGRFPYEFGRTKLPKAMRKNMLRRITAGQKADGSYLMPMNQAAVQDHIIGTARRSDIAARWEARQAARSARIREVHTPGAPHTPTPA